MLKVEKVTYSHPKQQKIWKDVSFSLKRGEVIGLSGKSGVGKSTFAKVLTGHLNPKEGSVVVDGALISSFKGKINPVQLFYQHPEFFFHPRWKVKTILKNFDVRKDVLEELEIQEEWYERYPHQLSGGELKRLALATLLKPEIKYLILDEFTSMLDPLKVEEMWKLIIKMKEKYHLGILVIDHHLTSYQHYLDSEISFS